jgi:hypothetical protein
VWESRTKQEAKAFHFRGRFTGTFLTDYRLMEGISCFRAADQAEQASRVAGSMPAGVVVAVLTNSHDSTFLHRAHLQLGLE